MKLCKNTKFCPGISLNLSSHTLTIPFPEILYFATVKSFRYDCFVEIKLYDLKTRFTKPYPIFLALLHRGESLVKFQVILFNEIKHFHYITNTITP